MEKSNFCRSLTQFHLRHNFYCSLLEISQFYNKIDMKIMIKYTTNEFKLYIYNRKYYMKYFIV